MTLVERVREALSGFGPMREVEMPGGVVFEWDGDALAGVENGVLRVRVEDGWAAVPDHADLSDVTRRAADVVIAECVARWHEDLRALGPDAHRAMLALVHHDPEREQLQRILLGCTTKPELRELAVTCLGHMGRLDREVLPEVVARLEELLDDPELGGAAEDALDEIESRVYPFRLWRRHSVPWVILAPPGDAEIARQLALVGDPDVVVVVPHAETLPSLPEHVRKLCKEVAERTHGDPGLHFVLEYNGDIVALQPLLHDEDQTAVFEEPYLLVW
ncbi:hypothetical protein SK571_39635 [Lentzea sp. BCCO 10_0798]|uniref:HEAT repeat-containing protein n=1 Tax=Lentzea kristufekii TaxID=3095430 RepID=A0ABU4U4N9_9PSEU|nr:hypothetical protein [Lentzea sp. BCCO 10_0798]MDX8055525.1 hypothetical protein [Lentzea sp. BCCO 10_0798]